MAAVHRLVLEGSAPALAKYYPSVGGSGEPARAWPAFRRTLTDHVATLRRGTRRPCQTNEVGRAAALVGGFHTVASETGLPLRELELGASAGLLLRWDHFAYRAGRRRWGDPASPVRIDWLDKAVPLHDRTLVASRAGCDLAPMDPRRASTRVALLSAVWPDQAWRFELLNGALEVARRVPAPLERAGAVDWLERKLAQPAPGLATVVHHSIVMQYVSADDRAAIHGLLHRRGDEATPDAPLAWLRLEPGGEGAEVRLTTWPGERERLLARSGFHGKPLTWLA